MANQFARAKQVEITRCVKGVAAAGVAVGKVVVGKDGSITIFPKDAVRDTGSNPWDDAE